MHEFDVHQCDQRRPAADGRRRTPAAGMILDLLEYWSVDLAASILIGVKEKDLAAAAAAGFESFRFAKGPLHGFTADSMQSKILTARSPGLPAVARSRHTI
jgi:D-glycero-D-manno-heptose 1,7-bisphosphate phosphatase